MTTGKRPRDFVRTLREALDTRDRHLQPVRAARVLGRNTDGTLRLLSLDGDCEVRGGVAQGSKGQVIVGANRPSYSRRGSAGVATRSSLTSGSTLSLDTVTPRLLPRGETVDLVLAGRGFTESTTFVFLLPDGTANPSITHTLQEYVDGETINLRVAVAGDADVFASAPVSCSDVGQPERSRANLYGVTADAVYYGFRAVDGDLEASRWAHATYLEDRGTTSATPSGEFLCPIARDSAGFVGDGSIAWAEWPASIRVWDVAAETVYEWDADVGEAVAAISPPAYVGGYLYWWTANATATTAKLWRSRCDLDPPSAIASVALPSLSPSFDYWEESTVRMAATTTATAAVFAYVDPNPDGTWYVAVSATLAGASGAATQTAVASDGAGLYLPGSGGIALSTHAEGDIPSVSTLAATATAQPVQSWPRTGAWWPPGEAAGAHSRLGISHNLAEAVWVYGAYVVHATAADPPFFLAAFEFDAETITPTYLVPIPEP